MSISSMAIQAGAQMAPDFMLSVNSKDVTANIRDRLISLTLTDNRGFEADQLDLELDDADGLLAPARALATKRVVVKRPDYAPPLGDVPTPNAVVTKGHRFDIYAGTAIEPQSGHVSD